LNASDTVAFPLIVVDAKNGASDFYKKFGFVDFFEEEFSLVPKLNLKTRKKNHNHQLQLFFVCQTNRNQTKKYQNRRLI